MSDGPVINPSIPATGASLSPRNTDTFTYRVVRELPVDGISPVGGTFTAWAQGEVFACVSGVGLGPVKNADIDRWLESGMIVRAIPLTPAQERALWAEGRLAATLVAETAESSPGAILSPPWAFPKS